MEIAHFHQESTLPALKEWLERGIFTKEEIKLIVRRREKFEGALLGRFQRQTDYLKYIEYEMTLHTLLRKRIKRLNVQLQGAPTDDGTGISGRVFTIFERALRRFKSDVSLWVEYIQAAKKLKARNLVLSLCARAVQQHPTSPALFLLSSSNELERGGYSAARTFLQRGLRLNPESVKLWTEYVKMELNYTETLRQNQEMMSNEEMKEIISDGAIVKTVMAQAMKDVKDLSMFYSLQTLIQTHPSPLRSSLLDKLYEDLISYHPSSPEARVLYASRLMEVESDSPAFVDGIRNANEELIAAIKKLSEEKDHSQGHGMVNAYVLWVEKQVVILQIDDLKRYIILSLTSLVSQIPPRIRTSSLLRASLQLSLHDSLFSFSSSEYASKLLKRARKYTSPLRQKGSRHDDSDEEDQEKEEEIWRDPEVWLARMNVEKACASSLDEVRNAWKEGRKVVRAKRTKDGGLDAEVLVQFWMWGVWHLECDEDSFEEVLRESKAHSLVTTLHTPLLLHYIQQTHPRLSPAERLTSLRSILSKDFPTSNFFQPAFAFESSLTAAPSPSSPSSSPSSTEAASKEIKPILQLIFERWRMVNGEEQASSRAWAEWLVRNGLGDEANKVIRTLVVGAGRRSVEREEVERWWNRVLNSLGGEKEREHGEDGVEGEGEGEVEGEEKKEMRMLKTTMEVDEGDVIWL